MPTLSIILDGDGALRGVDPEKLVHVTSPMKITCLPGGMASGAPSVGLVLTLPDGRTVLAETSLALLLMAADAFKARHGDPRTGERGMAAGASKPGQPV